MPLLRGVDIDLEVAILMRNGPHQLFAVHIIDIDVLLVIDDRVVVFIRPGRCPVRLV